MNGTKPFYQSCEKLQTLDPKIRWVVSSRQGSRVEVLNQKQVFKVNLIVAGNWTGEGNWITKKLKIYIVMANWIKHVNLILTLTQGRIIWQNFNGRVIALCCRGLLNWLAAGVLTEEWVSSFWGSQSVTIFQLSRVSYRMKLDLPHLPALSQLQKTSKHGTNTIMLPKTNQKHTVEMDDKVLHTPCAWVG